MASMFLFLKAITNQQIIELLNQPCARFITDGMFTIVGIIPYLCSYSESGVEYGDVNQRRLSAIFETRTTLVTPVAAKRID